VSKATPNSKKATNLLQNRPCNARLNNCTTPRRRKRKIETHGGRVKKALWCRPRGGEREDRTLPEHDTPKKGEGLGA